MPTAERYALNDLQQAVLDVLGDPDDRRLCVSRDEIIGRVVAMPGMDDVTGNHMGPCLAALKRRGLAKIVGVDGWYITSQGLGYVDQEEGEGDAGPADLDTAMATPIDFRPDNVTSPAPTEPEPDAANQGASTTACDDQWGEERPDAAEHMNAYERMARDLEGVNYRSAHAEDRVEQARLDADLWRGLDALLTLGHLRDDEKTERFYAWYDHVQHLAGGWYLWAIERLFQRNELGRNVLEIAGRHVDLDALARLPAVNVVVGSRDDITPPEQSLALLRHTEAQTHSVDAGHIGVFMGSSGIRDTWAPLFGGLSEVAA